MELNKRQSNLLGRFSIQSELGDTTSAGRLAKRLGRRGIADPAAALAEVEDPRALQENALWQISQRGALGGKRAKFLMGQLTKKRDLAEVGTWGDLARTSGIDEIGQNYDSLRTNLQGMFAGMDVNSPAVAAVLERSVGGRAEDTQRYLNDLGIRQSSARTDINNGIGLNFLGSTLDETGSLVESLKRLKEEESLLAKAQRGAIMGNPIAALYSGFSGSREGAIPFSNSAWTSFQRIMTGMSGMGGMGGGGGGGKGMIELGSTGMSDPKTSYGVV